MQAINPPRSPLFQAALALLGKDTDPLATAVQLRDAFPKATHAEIQAVVKETALLFHCAGVQPRVVRHG
jgi:hypothetical protein